MVELIAFTQPINIKPTADAEVAIIPKGEVTLDKSAVKLPMACKPEVGLLLNCANLLMPYAILSKVLKSLRLLLPANGLFPEVELPPKAAPPM